MSYDETRRRIEALTDDRGFEKLATTLLARLGLDVRPMGGSGDQGRDAVVGLFTTGEGEELAITISLDQRWGAKIERDITRIRSAGLTPKQVISVTNRAAPPQAIRTLQGAIAGQFGIDLTVYDQRWLVTQMHLRGNLDLRGEHLNLAPPRPAFFLDLSEFESLLEKRGMLAAPFLGRTSDLEELGDQLSSRAHAVVLEGAGGIGKTRLAFEHAKSGRSSTPWFFVDFGLPFDIDYLAELEAGYEATVLIDDAHRRSDFQQLLRALERREPVPHVVLTIRPGQTESVATPLRELGFQPLTLRIDQLGRSALNTILGGEPFVIASEAMRTEIIRVSEGNVGVALIAAMLAAKGIEPYELSNAELFAFHIELRLRGAGAASRETREVLALLAAVGHLDLGQAPDVAAAVDLLGITKRALRRQLDELADCGIVSFNSPGSYAIKPDIMREHLLRASYFPDGRQPLLPYLDVWASFSPHRLRSLLSALGEAQIETTSGGGQVVATVRDAVIERLSQATTTAELGAALDEVKGLGAGGASVVLEAAMYVHGRLATLDDAAIDSLGPRLVEALGAAKFGQDHFAPAWRLLLDLAATLLAKQASLAVEAVQSELLGVYSAVPMSYSRNEAAILAYVQSAIHDVATEWWSKHRDEPGAAGVALILVRTFFQFTLEKQWQSPGNAMAFTMAAGFLPGSPTTTALVELGSRLFRESFLKLDPLDQIKALDGVDSLARVAAGYSGPFGSHPRADLRQLAREALRELDEWLASNIPDLTLPIAAAVWHSCRSRNGRRQRVSIPRPGRELRAYLDLVDNTSRRPLRVDYLTEQAEIRSRGARYGRRIAKAQDPMAEIEVLNERIAQCEEITRGHANHIAINAALEEVAKVDGHLAQRLAAFMVEGNLLVARFTDGLLDTLAADPKRWPMILSWADHSSPDVRRAAARAVRYNPDDLLLKRIVKKLAPDPDDSVRRMVWGALTYGSARELSGWRLDQALDITRTLAAPLDSLDTLLRAVRIQVPGGEVPPLTSAQRRRVKGIILDSARVDATPSQHRVRTTLEEAEVLGLDLVLPWVRTRLEFLRSRQDEDYIVPLPDEVRGMVQMRRKSATARRELVRLMAELGAHPDNWRYRSGLTDAITWLGDDSPTLTRQVAWWATGEEAEIQLALTFAVSSQWTVFTKRAKALLDALPGDIRVHQVLIRGREPMSFIGSREPYYRGVAEQYRQWVSSTDRRLRAIGEEAVALYEARADEAANEDRQRQERI